MASLHFTCPQTHQKVSTGVETDAQSLRASWKATLKVDCPYCGAVHEISVREYRQRYSCRDRSVGPCLARMGPSDLRRKW
jgi:hypothetical protein